MINKSKTKIFQKYYRMNPHEYLEILDKWRTKSERQDKLLKETLKHIKTFWELTESKEKKILFSTMYACEINNFLERIEKLTDRIQKEVAKIGVFETEKPQKEDKIFKYQKAWNEYKDTLIYAKQFQKTVEENYRLCQQFNEANELLKQIYTHLTEKGVRTTWETIADANTWTKILDKLKKRFNHEKETKKMDI